MGVVYRALDTKLNRPVAIKLLSNELADAEARRRFQREAQLASALNHPHILTVYDAGEFGTSREVDRRVLDARRIPRGAGQQAPELFLVKADRCRLVGAKRHDRLLEPRREFLESGNGRPLMN